MATYDLFTSISNEASGWDDAATDCRIEMAPAAPRRDAEYDVVEDVFYRTDLDDRIEYISSTVRHLGYRPEKLVGASASQLIQTQVPREEILTILLAKGFVRDIDVEVRASDGRHVRGSLSVILVHDANGLPCGVEAVLRDANQRRQLQDAVQEAHEAMLAARRAKAELLAVVSHEVRTPLNAVLGMCELLHDTSLSAPQQECVDSIATSGRTVLRMIDNILQYASGDGGRFPTHSFDFDLHETVNAALAYFADGARHKGLRLDAWIDKDVPAIVRGDRARIEQVMINLIGNAVKFTREGGVMVRLLRLPVEGSCVAVRFEVVDTGVGIPPEAQSYLFEPFASGDTSTTRHQEGLGLGLALARRVAEMMGGEVGFVTEPGSGSTFWLDIVFESALAPIARAS